MTNTLLVAATEIEVSWLRKQLHFANRTDVQLVVTGIGMVNCAWKLGQAILQFKPQQVIQFGVAGAYTESLTLTEVVEVTEETFGELGAETADGFLDLAQLGLPVLQNPICYNTFHQPKPLRLTKLVSGLTCNTIHGEMKRIELLKKRWNKDIETMEGAVLFQLCLAHQISFAEFRAISNYVEPRCKERWKLTEASQNMQEFIWKHFLV
ncbi:MAG: futalosine hydrolase [Bacteroidia bacterium]|nr:futalosine hydrolase [Bacteroidia bacterium]